MAGTGWRTSLVRLALCAGFLCAAWMLLGAGQARADEVSGSHDRGSHAAKSLGAAARLRRVGHSVGQTVGSRAAKVSELGHDTTSLAAPARPVAALVRRDLSAQLNSVKGLAAEARPLVSIQRRIGVPTQLPSLSARPALGHGAAQRIQTRSAAPAAVHDVSVVPAVRAAVVTLAPGWVQGAATPGFGVLRSSAAPVPQLPPDPVVPWPPTPSPTSPSLQRGLETASGATEFAIFDTTPGATEPQSVRYAGALALPGSSALRGPDQRPD